MSDPSHLPDPVPSHLQVAFTTICHDFEQQWRDASTSPPRIEMFTDRVAAEDHKRLVDILISLEIRLRLKS